MDRWFSRDAIAAGLPGRRATALLASIERRTAFLVGQSRRAIEIFLTPDTAAAPRIDTLHAFRQAHHDGIVPTLADLERFAPQWRHLVPDDHSVRAALLRRIGQKYVLAPGATPHLAAALGLDDPAVEAAYQRLFDEPVATLVRNVAGPEERAPWTSPVPGLDGAVLEEIEAALERISLAAGEALFRQGDAADAMYIVTHGRVRLAAQRAGGDQVIAEIGPGEGVGAMAVLSEEVRQHRAYASRDTDLVKLSKAGFERLMERYPRAALQVTRTILTRSQQPRSLTGRIPNTVVGIAVVPAAPDVPLGAFGERLAEALGSFGSALHLTAERLDHLLEAGAAQVDVSETGNGAIVAWLGEQEAAHRFIVYVTDPVSSAWTRRCLRQADRILLVGRRGADPSPGPIEHDSAWHQATARKEFVLLDMGDGAAPSTRAWLALRQVAAHHHVRLKETSDFQQLGRRLTGRAVGLVLGGGGARGLAHAGVLRAFTAAGIPIDLIGGTSIGALVAGFHATGMDDAEILATFRTFSSRRRLFDPTLPVVSMLAGRKLTTMLTTTLGDANIEDLAVPYFCAASSLTKAEPVVLRQGPIWRAVRASCAMAGVWSPLAHEGDLLVDGGYLNNLPVDVMRELSDGGQVIGMDVNPAEDLVGEYELGPTLSGWQVLWSRLAPFRRATAAPPLFATLLRASALSGVNQAAATKRLADLIIAPPVAPFGINDYAAFEPLIEVGYRAARTALASWRACGDTE